MSDNFPLSKDARFMLLHALVAEPRKATQKSGLGYDVLRSAALGGPVQHWNRFNVLRALQALGTQEAL